MKIAHIISGGDTGGAKTHVLTLLVELMKEGINVELICVMEGVFTKEALELGIPIKIFKQKARYDIKTILRIGEYLKNEKFDLIHSHGARGNYICRIVKNKIEKPFITTVHSDYKIDFIGNIYKRIVYTKLNRYFLNTFDYYLTVTEAFKEMLGKRNFDKRKIYTIYNGIYLGENNADQNFLQLHGIDKKEDHVYVGMVARLDPIKGIGVFIKAIKELEDEKIVFMIAGEGEHKEKYLSISKELGLKNLYFLGYIEKIHDFYNVLDINVLTSLSESFPYALLEGGVNKKATIATEVGGIPEMIEHDKTGILVKKNNYVQLSKEIKRLADDSDLRIELGNNFFKEIEKSFSATRMSRRHVEIYNNILNNWKRR